VFCVFTKSTGIVVRYGKDDVVVVALFGKVVVVASDLYLYLLDVWVTQMLVMTALKQHAHAFIFLGMYVFHQMFSAAINRQRHGCRRPNNCSQYYNMN